MAIAISNQVKRWISAAIAHGGERQRAAQKAERIIGGLSVGRAPELVGRTTSHGESRLRCTKYDLGNGYRLVSLRRAETSLLLRLDGHEACDRWLDQQQGKAFEVSGINGHIELPPQDPPEPKPAPSKGIPEPERLIAALKDGVFDGLALRASDVRALTRLGPGSSDQELAAAVAELGDLSRPMLQVLQFLRNGDHTAARQTLHALRPEQSSPLQTPELTLKDSAPEQALGLSKKQRRQARRSARSERRQSDESSFNRMDPERLRALRDEARRAAETLRAEAEAERARREELDEDKMSFAELLERYSSEPDD
jgi:hypothetical protein